MGQIGWLVLTVGFVWAAIIGMWIYLFILRNRVRAHAIKRIRLREIEEIEPKDGWRRYRVKEKTDEDHD